MQLFLGLILGIKFKKNEIAKAVVEKRIGKELHTNQTVQKVMRILHHLNVKKAGIEQAIKTIDKALKEVKDA